MATVKIFISHQKQDSSAALRVQNYMKGEHDIDCYLDVIDPHLTRGEEIADHLRNELSKCSHLLAIVSEATKSSWWVPWEIGVATEKDFPLATFGTNVDLPEYLMKWPYLKSQSDLTKYAQTISEMSRETMLLDGVSNESFNTATASVGRSSTRRFYRSLRFKLGQ